MSNVLRTNENLDTVKGRNGAEMSEIPLTFILVAVIFIGQQVCEGIAVQDNISSMAHIIGGIVGAVMGYVLNLKRKI